MTRINKEEKAIIQIFNLVLLEEVRQKHSKKELELLDKIFAKAWIVCKDNNIDIKFKFTPIKKSKKKSKGSLK